MKQRGLGNTGVLVSEFCLGAMNFGMADWGIDESASLEVIRAYFDAGGNFIDTADVYGAGTSERICGQAIRGRRERVVLATKGHFPVVERFGDPPAHENAWGSSRLHLTRALEESLRRLQTDYVDLYQVHCWDRWTPIEETLATLDAFVKSGKARYVGLSNFDAWQIAESRQLCIRHGWEPFVTAQMQYSLVCRDIELAVVPVCQRYRTGILAWSPLAGGMLTGKYARDGRGPADSRFMALPDPDNEWRKAFLIQRNFDIVDELQSVARELGAAPAAVALAWLLGRPAVNSVIIGPKSIRQLHDNLASCDLTLPESALQRLDRVSRPQPSYPARFIHVTDRNRLDIPGA